MSRKGARAGDEELARLNPKKSHQVTVHLDTGNDIPGFLFLAPDHNRVQDLLNDDDHRPFLPFMDQSGQVRLLNRRKIVYVKDDAKAPIRRLDKMRQ